MIRDLNVQGCVNYQAGFVVGLMRGEFESAQLSKSAMPPTSSRRVDVINGVGGISRITV
jgi:hypothetical protein